MQFLSLRDLFKYCEISHVTFNTVNLSWAKEIIEGSSELYLELNQKKYTQQEVLLFLDELDDEKIIFQEWIDSSIQLSKVLKNREFSTKYEDDIRLKGHFLFNKFKSYLSQFLHETIRVKFLEAFKDEDYKTANIIDSYKVLLSKQSKDNVELIADAELRNLVSNASLVLNTADSKKSLINQMRFITDVQLIEIYNRQSKTYYNSKLELVNFAVVLFQYKHFTIQFAKHVFQSIKNLELNPEHQDQIKSLSANLNAGKVKVKSSGKEFSLKKMTFMSSGSIILLLFLSIIISIVVFFSFSKEKKVVSVNNNHGGFDSLSLKDLQQVDSLLGLETDTLQLEIEDVGISINSNAAYVVTTSTIVIENEIVKQLQKDLLMDFDIQNLQSFTGYKYTDCNALRAGEFRNFNMTNIAKFDTNVGFNHVLENNSSFDIYFITYSNIKHGKVRGVLIPSGGKVTVNLDKRQHVLFYAGNDMSKFSPARSENQGYGNINDAKKVSKNFNYHFCYQDDKTYALLNKVYLVEGNNVNSSTRITDSNALGLIVNSEVIKKKN